MSIDYMTSCSTGVLNYRLCKRHHILCVRHLNYLIMMYNFINESSNIWTFWSLICTKVQIFEFYELFQAWKFKYLNVLIFYRHESSNIWMFWYFICIKIQIFECFDILCTRTFNYSTVMCMYIHYSSTMRTVGSSLYVVNYSCHINWTMYVALLITSSLCYQSHVSL
jgi:hypothetical protein